MWPDRRLIDLLQIQHPILLSPMAGFGTVDLAAGVCAAGGLGSIGCAVMEPEFAAKTICALRGLTNKPINVNLGRGLGLEDFVLFGHSWGGMLALEYALIRPQPLRGLVISNMAAGMKSYLKHTAALKEALLAPPLLAKFNGLEAAKDYNNPEYKRIVDSIRDSDLERGLSILHNVLNSDAAVRVFFTELRFLTNESLVSGRLRIGLFNRFSGKDDYVGVLRRRSDRCDEIPNTALVGIGNCVEEQALRNVAR
jgi:Nitronate monooxygenase/alpha/beta hydrolase fold